MEYPPNPTHEFRVQTLAPAMVLVLAIAALEPFAAIAVGVTPFQLSEPGWRVHAFALIFGAIPPLAIELVLIAAIGVYAGYYRAVRCAAFAALVTAVVLIPILLFDALDVMQVRGIVAADRVHAYMLSALQGAVTAGIMVPVLFWLAFRGYHAGKKGPAIAPDTHLVIGQGPPAR